MSEFILWLSGVDRNALSHCERERNKFIAMGGTVLTTAGLAVLTATFTIHNFLHAPLVFAVVLGLGWGLAIMNLDRWLLISIRRQTTTRKTIAMGIPRVGLAILIGAVIAHPLVLQVFNKEVEAQAEKDKNSALAEGKKEIREQFAAIPQLVREEGELRPGLTAVADGQGVEKAPEYQAATDELKHLEKREANLQAAALCEADGRCGSKKIGEGPAYEAKAAVAESIHAQVESQRNVVAGIRRNLHGHEASEAEQTREASHRRLDGIEASRRTLEAERERARKDLIKTYNEEIGLLDRVEALDNLTVQRPELLTMELLIFFFILAIDTMPAVMKVLMSIGDPSLYEVVQKELEEADVVALREQTKAHAQASEIEAGILIDEATTRRELMKEAQDHLVRQSVDAMREAGEKFIALWREAILARVPDLVRGELARAKVGEAEGGHGEGGAGGDGSGEPGRGANGNGAGGR